MDVNCNFVRKFVKNSNDSKIYFIQIHEMEEIENGIASFLIGSDELSLLATKLLQDLSKKELLTDGFDDEQIFQQIEVYN